MNGIVNYEVWLPFGELATPESKQFLDKYQARSAAAGVDRLGYYLPPFGYAEMQVLQQAIEGAEGLDQDRIADYLRTHTLKGPTSATAVFADGSVATGDLLVAADGIHSTVRRLLLPDTEPRYAGYVTWRGVVDEADAPAGVRALLSDRLTFCFPEGELLLAMPNPSSDNDMRRRYYFVWYRPADYESALPALCTDASGHQHGLSIPPHLIRREVVDDLKACAERQFEPFIAGLIRSAKQLLLLPVFDLESPRMVFGRVALLGDAAFVAWPHVVAGVTKAALDAGALADVLGNWADMGEALASYAAVQRELGRKLVERGCRLGAFLQPDASISRGDERSHWGRKSYSANTAQATWLPVGSERPSGPHPPRPVARRPRIKSGAGSLPLLRER